MAEEAAAGAPATRPLTFGLFDWLDRGDGELPDLYEQRLRMLEYADEAGYYCYHLAEHHGTPLGMAPAGSLSSTVLDLGRFLVGEVKSVSALTRTFIEERPLPGGKGKGKVDVDDAFISLFEFENGAIGTLEASRFCAGRKNHNTFEINGSKGTIVFDLEDMNRLQVYYQSEAVAETAGFHNVLVSEAHHPFWSLWWPHGHIIGWEHTFVHEIAHLLDAIVNDGSVEPYGASFRDGYRNAVVCDAILQSAEQGRRIVCEYEA